VRFGAGSPTGVPVSIYQHSRARDRGVDEFTAYTLDFRARFDPDYVKVMYDEMYDTPVNYQFATDASVWETLERLDPHKGAFGRYLESLKIVRNSLPADTPIIGTVFTPFPYRGSSRLEKGSRGLPDRRGQAQEGLGCNRLELGRLHRRDKGRGPGIDGFLVGAYGAAPEWLAEHDYMELEAPFGRELLAAMKGMPFVMVHEHGEKGSYFNLFSAYNCNALSWEDRVSGPSLGEARGRTSKCLIGGVDHIAAQTYPAEQVYAQARGVIAAIKGAGSILAPGCTFLGGTPAENMLALKKASLDASDKASRGAPAGAPKS